MDRSAADAFVCAKASGMLAKSFVGDKLNNLFSVSSLQELWHLVFKTEIPAIPEILLAKKIEEEAAEKFIKDYISLLQNYNKPQQILIENLRFYDYENIKEITSVLSIAKEKQINIEKPKLVNIGNFSMLKYSAWPNIADITANTILSWCNSIPDFSKKQELDFRLDEQYIRNLWTCIEKSNISMDIKKIIQDELIMNNVLWALRLRVYYSKTKDQIIPMLITSRKCKTYREFKNDPLTKDTIKTFDFNIKSFSDWKNWKYAQFLNPNDIENDLWEIDPRWIQQSFKVYVNKKILKQFHKNICPTDKLFIWFKIKQFELDCIRTVAEGFRLGIESEQIKTFVGVSSVLEQ